MKTVKICTLALAAGMVLSCAASCTKVKPTETTTDTSASSSETPSTLDTIRISEDPTEPTESEESTGFYEKTVYTGEDETYVNTFITNFAEQYFHEMPEDGKFDVKNASVEDILTFVYFHIKINSYKDFAPGTKGECSYATFTFAKAAEVTGRYRIFRLPRLLSAAGNSDLIMRMVRSGSVQVTAIHTGTSVSSIMSRTTATAR